MPTNFKCNLFFGQGTYGWSETYYREEESYNACLEALDKLREKRIALLAKGASCIGSRVSDDAFQNDGQVLEPPNVPVEQVNDPNEAGVDQPWTCLLLRLQAGPVYRRQLYIRGIPDEAVAFPFKQAENTVIGKKWWTRMRGFTSLLTTSWRLKTMKRVGVGFNGTQLITVVPGVGLGTYVLTLTADVGVAPNSLIHLYRNARQSQWNGNFRVIETGVRTVTVYNGRANPAIGQLKGKARILDYQYPQITEALVVRWTHRDTGRPFDASRGRQRARN